MLATALESAVPDCDGGSGSGDFTYEKFGSAYKGIEPDLNSLATLRDLDVILHNTAS